MSYSIGVKSDGGVKSGAGTLYGPAVHQSARPSYSQLYAAQYGLTNTVGSWGIPLFPEVGAAIHILEAKMNPMPRCSLGVPLKFTCSTFIILVSSAFPSENSVILHEPLAWTSITH